MTIKAKWGKRLKKSGVVLIISLQNFFQENQIQAQNVL